MHLMQIVQETIENDQFQREKPVTKDGSSNIVVILWRDTMLTVQDRNSHALTPTQTPYMEAMLRWMVTCSTWLKHNVVP